MAAKKNLKIIERDPLLQNYAEDLELRMQLYKDTKKKILPEGASLDDFANGNLYYGFHPVEGGWIYREWAPGADSMALIGDFNNWDRTATPMKRINDYGDWEVTVTDLPHKSFVKVQVTHNGETFDRLPLYIHRVVQNPETYEFRGQIWHPDEPFEWTDQDFKTAKKPLLIYETHVGMSDEEGHIASYDYFTDNVLPRVKANGYNTIQMMAIMQHPYYASFGYQVSNFFAASSWYGEPEGLKRLINRAHELGITVLLDLVHSHATTNTADGINQFDGTNYQFFHDGPRGDHPAWGTKLFNYGKPAVLHFLLSNLKYWMEEYHFDGFRFDGVTSMLYLDHGLGANFDSYGKYFSANTDTEAITYLQLANELIHSIRKDAVTIAEDMSGLPGMCLPIKEGGVGFDYRLCMGLPDYWIKNVSKIQDEYWDIGKMWYELTTRRPGEKAIAYCESHDQALVGDKTIIFWLADQEMYWHMNVGDLNQTIERAMELHKMIRLVTMAAGGDGYLNFMGNEFGHPEWIDFPREGNGGSFQHCRRQWSLADNPNLKYSQLQAFDNAMIALNKKGRVMDKTGAKLIYLHYDNKTLAFTRGEYLFVFNFHPTKDAWVDLHSLRGNKYKRILGTAEKRFGGWIADEYWPVPEVFPASADAKEGLYLPKRSAYVYKKKK